MSKEMKRAYKYRFYPTGEQKKTLAQTFGCCRCIYNWGLSTRKTAYFQRGQSLSYNDLAAMLPTLKEEYPWLKEVSSVPLQQALRHLERAFVNFFEGRAEYPTFKKKRHDQSAIYAANAFTWDGKALTLAKMDTPWMSVSIAFCPRDASRVVYLVLALAIQTITPVYQLASFLFQQLSEISQITSASQNHILNVD